MDANKIVKYVGIAFVVIILVMIATGNMGGSKEATGNYRSVMTGG
jgi:hypothetical protein